MSSLALLLAGCSPAASSNSAASGAITIAASAPFTSANSQSLAGEGQTNSTVSELTSSWFTHYDATPKLVDDTRFGTQVVLRTSPLTVRYTIKPGVTWSDGAPVGAADLLLDWASSISRYNVAGGVDFTSASEGSSLDLVTSVPTISDGGRAMTVVFSKPDVDWATALPRGMLPAHAVWARAYPGTKAASAAKKVIAAITTNNTSALTALAKAWSTGFAATSTPRDRTVILSDGPYAISSISGTSIALKLNQTYRWGSRPKISTLRFRVIQDPGTQLHAIQTGGVELVTGLSNVDLSAVATRNVTAVGVPTGNYEHIDLTMNNGGPFDASAYSGAASKALEVRQAFLKALPRTQLLDSLIHPISPTENLDNSQVLPPGADGYAAAVTANGSSDYDEVDIAGAKALLAQAGAAGVKVRLLYAKSNTMRAQEVALITASEAKAGITVVPEANDSWPDLLGNGSYDAVLFDWDYTSLDVDANTSIFQSAGANNFTGYNDPATDRDIAALSTEYDHAKQLKLLANVDKNAWADAYGATLYEVPVIDAWSKQLKNVQSSPLGAGAFWNAPVWNSGS